MRFTLLPVVLMAVSGCATIATGTSQAINVSTVPPGASCTLDRVGERVGVVPMTPGTVTVDKTKHDLAVTCAKDGYQTVTVTHEPTFNLAVIGNVVAGGVIGLVVDASTGAIHNYPANLRVDLPPKQVAAAARLLPAVMQGDAGSSAAVQPARVEAIGAAPH